MTWLARLPFGHAVRWALIWPALVIAASLAFVVGLIARHGGGVWAFGWDVESHRGVPLWLAATLALGSVLFGPSLLFLALWRVARRSGVTQHPQIPT